MAEFNFKQAIYAGMIAVAGSDDDVTKTEEKIVNEIFHHSFALSKNERKEVIEKFNSDKSTFTDLVITELNTHTPNDKKLALKNIAHFIHIRKNNYNLSTKKQDKGIDEEKAELNAYEERFEHIKKALGY